jgi:Ni2+-binding GTPase involved in maturation of urease and hydrogenase
LLEKFPLTCDFGRFPVQGFDRAHMEVGCPVRVLCTGQDCHSDHQMAVHRLHELHTPQ